MTSSREPEPRRRRTWLWILAGGAAAFVGLVVAASIVVMVFWRGLGERNVPMEMARMVERMNPGTDLGLQAATGAGLPDWIPLMEGIDVSGFTSQGGGLLMGSATAPARDVLAFYARQLEAAGLEIAPGGYTEQSDGKGGTVQARSPDGCRSVLVAVGEERGATQIHFQFQDCGVASHRGEASAGGWTRPVPEGPPRAEGEVRIRSLHTFTTQQGFIRALRFSADGLRLASASTDGSIRLWNLTTGEEELVHREQGRPEQRFPYIALALHPQGRLLSHASRGEWILRDTVTGSVQQTIVTGADVVSDVAFDAEGDVLAVLTLEPSGVQLYGAGDSWTRRWQAETDGSPEGLAWSAAGDRLAFAVPCRSLELWDAVEGRRIGGVRASRSDLRLCGEYFAAAFSPDLTLAASANDGPEIRRWDLERGRFLGELVNPRGGSNLEGVTALAFDPSGELLAAGTVDGRVELWHWSSASLRGELFEVTGSDVSRIAFSRDGRLMAVGDWYGVVRVLELE